MKVLPWNDLWLEFEQARDSILSIEVFPCVFYSYWDGFDFINIKYHGEKRKIFFVGKKSPHTPWTLRSSAVQRDLEYNKPQTWNWWQKNFHSKRDSNMLACGNFLKIALIRCLKRSTDRDKRSELSTIYAVQWCYPSKRDDAMSEQSKIQE